MRSPLTEALALVGGPVYEDLGADDVAKGQEHLHELRVAKLLGQVVDEKVAALRARDGAAWKRRDTVREGEVDTRYYILMERPILDMWGLSIQCRERRLRAAVVGGADLYNTLSSRRSLNYGSK